MPILEGLSRDVVVASPRRSALEASEYDARAAGLQVEVPEMKSKTIYFVAGEVSADNHGAALLRSLREFNTGLNFRAWRPAKENHRWGAILKLDRESSCPWVV